MSLKITTEEDEQRQLKVTVEVPEERVEKQMRKTARQVARGVNIPGFRPGKVPYPVIVRRVGRDALRTEAVEEIVNPVFEEALAEIDVTPYGQPSLEDMQLEPLVVEFNIPMEPVVTLGDYRAIRREIEPVEVTQEALEEALEHIRTHHQVLEPVDRPAMEGDVVAVSGTGEIIEEDSTEVIFDEERAELLLDAETTFSGTAFVENIIGMEVGDEGEFTITFPEDDDDEELAGRKATFNVTVLDVKSRYLPPLDDDLAREEGDYETLDELREELERELRQQAERQARDELFDDVMEAIDEDAEITYPPVAVEQELDQMVQNLKDQVTRSGWQWDDYLKLQGETEESLREQWQEQAERRVRRGLALQEFIRQEKIRPSEEALDLAVEERLDRFADNEELRDQMRDFFRQGQGLELIGSEVVMDLVHERIKAIVTGEAPDLEALEEEDESTVDEEE